jgi:glucans biosynthesis protein C
MTAANRKYDIDWLRVIAIVLLLIYHISIAFQPWGVMIGFIQNSESMTWLWVPMSLLNTWRIPLLFFVSGMGVSFALRKRNWRQLMLERTKRILVPFIFGLFCIVPLHFILWQKYYNQDISYVLNPSHLWFLANIFIYVLFLSPLFLLMKRKENGSIKKLMHKIFTSPLGLLLITGLFVLEAVILKPELYATFAMNYHGFFVGLLAFLSGFCIIYAGEAARKMIMKWRWMTLASGLTLFVIRYTVFELAAPNYLVAIESNMWIFASFGFAFKYLNRPGKAVVYLSQAAYPVYILHMFFLFLGSYIIIPLEIPAFLKFILIIVFTFAACFLVYEFILRRLKFLRPLFGLKLKKNL